MRRRLMMLGLIFPFVLVLSACGGGAASAIAYEDLPPSGDPEKGEALFNESVNRMPACIACHIEGAAAAPYLADFAAVAGERVPEQSAREYTFYAITEPGQHIVEGYGNAMYADYDNRLSPEQIADLIAYLLQNETE